MSSLSPETVWNANEKELLTLLNKDEFASKLKTIRFYAPSFTYYRTHFYCSSPVDFPTISITGTGCSLNCKHCGGKVLETMHPANTPEKLYELCVKLKKDGASGCLISGGCMPDGSVPLNQFIPSIKKIKRELGFTIFVHTGIIDSQTAFSLKDAGVDAALIDVIGSNETIRKIYNLNVTVRNYADSLKALQRANLNFVPHIIVGLNDGKLNGEFKALQITSMVRPSALVMIAFMPIYGTAMAQTKPPTPYDIAKVTAAARLMFPKTPMVLGCIRPKGKMRGETDILALKAGVDAIAFPSEEVIQYAQDKGFEIFFSSFCCAQIYFDAAFRSASK